MRILLLVVFLLACITPKAQTTEIDSLKKALAGTTDNVKRVTILESLSYTYLDSYPDTALKYALNGLELARNINHRKGEAICINALGNVYFHIGDNAKALEYYLEYLKIKEELKDQDNIAVAYFNISAVYTEEKDYQHALFYLFKAKHEDEKAKDSSAILYDAYSLASNYQRMQKQDSALFYINQCYNLAKLLNDENMMGAILNTYGEIYLASNDTALASKYYRSSIPYAEAVQDDEVVIANYYGLAKILKESNPDFAIYYSTKALNIARQASFFKQVLEISGFVTELFKEKKQFDSAFYYQQLSMATKDSLFNTEQLRKVQNLKFSEQQREQAIETARLKYRNRIKLFITIFIAIAILIIAILLWRNNKRVAAALLKLRATQAQLIQSEKMASLGELTAGIAHEIQNPLNFVNNFSEVNNELIEELKAELKTGNQQLITNIANDIQANLERINHHGKRAEVIVKSMLQHSKKGTGQREETDINDLCDEYLRLSYHVFRAKDKSFNAEIKTVFDKTLSADEAGIGKINIVPQDIGRALLNIFNNAFYAVNEKQKKESAKGNTGYNPFVSVETKKGNGSIEIKINDNGEGIPKNIIHKIFQPFFTTKPTGQGTGLGLSLAYDIITKQHNGTIKVESEYGTGTNFIVIIPI